MCALYCNLPLKLLTFNMGLLFQLVAYFLEIPRVFCQKISFMYFLLVLQTADSVALSHFQAVNFKTLDFDFYENKDPHCLDMVTRLDCISSVAATLLLLKLLRPGTLQNLI